MKKLIYTEDFERRFSTAAKNGSKVCADILKAIKTPDNVKDGVSANYLTTVKVNHGRRGDSDNFATIRSVKVTCCTKDFSNGNNPEHGSPVGMWRPENRASLDLQRIVGFFKSLDDVRYTDVEYAYAAGALAIDEPLKVMTWKGMANIEKAYNLTNYSAVTGRDDTLWSSCVRYPETANVAGDFYANFCGAKIIVAMGAISGAIYGRAILWPEIEVNHEKGAFLDRVYFTYDVVRLMMYDYAKSQGVKFRKYNNTYDSKRYFVKFDDPSQRITANVTIAVPRFRWHKYGSPYTDTFSWVDYKNEHFYLSNYASEYSVVQTDSTGTTGMRINSICPVCGKVHSSRLVMCRDCYDTYMKQTIVGTIYTGKVNKRGEPILPKKYADAAKRVQNL